MIIITGITGQDGAYLARHLLSEDKEVVGILRRPKKESHLDGLKFLAIEDKVMLDIADLTDFEAVVKLIDRYKPECIYNLAAQSSVGRSFKYPQDTLYFNTDKKFLSNNMTRAKIEELDGLLKINEKLSVS